MEHRGCVVIAEPLRPPQQKIISSAQQRRGHRLLVFKTHIVRSAAR